MKKILHFLHVKAPADRVYAALTTQEGLAGWWTARVRVPSGVGGIVDFRFLEGFNPDMEVMRLEEDRRVEWKCVGGHDNWQDNTFSFRLTVADGGTDLMFVQIYARELSDEVYGNYNFNWGYYLHSLKQLCETGAGTPYEAGG
jgi:uncharacterized protein YndB with AHSA1/START domain